MVFGKDSTLTKATRSFPEWGPFLQPASPSDSAPQHDHLCFEDQI
jgi:hypothetical protein